MKQRTQFDVTQVLRYELRFLSLLEAGRVLAFPCDVDGQVDIGGMSERSRSDYFYARKFVGREYSLPSVAIVA